MTSGEKISVEFPGQGMPYGELIKELSDKNAVGSEAYDEAADVFDNVQEATGIDVRSLVASQSIEELSDTRIAQILLFAAGYAGGRILVKKGVNPNYYRGHSAAAYTAAGLAGAVALKSTAKLIQKRGELMHEAAQNHPGGAAVTDLSLDRLVEICQKAGVFIANHNSPVQSVISGENEPLRVAIGWIKQAGARATPFRNWKNGPVHSPLFQEEENQLRSILQDAEIVNPTVSFVKTTDGQITNTSEGVREDLGGMAQPVRWADGTLTLLANGVSKFIEVSPSKKRILAGLLEDHGIKDTARIKHLFDFL